MNKLTAALAGLSLFGVMAAGPATPAKADGGAVAIGVGAYLVVDAIVGRKCHRDDWPFNLVAKLADEIHGRRGCYRHGHYKRHYHRHYHRKHHD
jgi:hypothetical protein